MQKNTGENICIVSNNKHNKISPFLILNINSKLPICCQLQIANLMRPELGLQ